MRGINPFTRLLQESTAESYLEDRELDTPVDDADAEGRRPRHLQRQDEEAIGSDSDPIGTHGQGRIFWENRRPQERTYEGQGADAGVGARGERHGGGAGQRDLSRREGGGEGLRRLRRGGEEEGEEEVGWALYGPSTRCLVELL